jgi:hypothetical protein
MNLWPALALRYSRNAGNHPGYSELSHWKYFLWYWSWRLEARESDSGPTSVSAGKTRASS